MSNNEDTRIDNPIEIEAVEPQVEVEKEDPRDVELKEIRKELQATKQIMMGVAGSIQTNETRSAQHQLIQAKLETQQARASGDIGAFEKALQKEMQMTNVINTTYTEPVEVIEFKNKNPFFTGQDPDMDKEVQNKLKNHAIVLEKDYRATHPGCSASDALRYAHEQIRKDFPNDFGRKLGTSRNIMSNDRRPKTENTDYISAPEVVNKLDVGERAYYDYLVDKKKVKEAQEVLKRYLKSKS